MNRVKFFKMLAAAAVVGGVAVFGVVGCADKSPASQNREKLSTGTDNVCESEAGCPDYDTEQGTSAGDVLPAIRGSISAIRRAAARKTSSRRAAPAMIMLKNDTVLRKKIQYMFMFPASDRMVTMRSR